ncbi:MAG: type II toxin-antitoxin system death-on-curing family toxin [Candidatus Eisenbacteria bacterium]
MKRAPRWLSTAAILALHERLIAEHGGAASLRDERLLESALASPLHHLAYADADLFGLAAAYASALTRNHPFHDGTKRIALTAAGVFLELNGYRLIASELEAAGATRALAERAMDEAAFAEWLRRSSVKARRRR